jgi:hypothetical protein
LNWLRHRLVDVESGIGDVGKTFTSFLLQAAMKQGANQRRSICRQRIPIRFSFDNASENFDQRLAIKRRLRSALPFCTSESM